MNSSPAEAVTFPAARHEVPAPAPQPQRDDSDPADARRILAAAIEILRQGERLLTSLPGAAYTANVPVAFNASIGGHYRHCLDHFTSLLAGLDDGRIDYDHRRRDARIETLPEFALAATRRLRTEIDRLDPATLWSPVTTRCEVSYAHGDAARTTSSAGREFVYVIAHAIHHYALISVMARVLDVALPADFGVAPSTVAHRRSMPAG